MKLIKKYAGLLLMLTLLVGFTSCEDDEDLEERMFGRVWVGDVGMNAVNGRILYSEFTFDPDGFGEEYQFFRNGELYDHFRFQWYWEDRYSNNLVLDYGRNGTSYMDNVDIYRGVMTGIFYLTGDSEGFPFVLEMQ
jgi:hypothetical protein